MEVNVKLIVNEKYITRQHAVEAIVSLSMDGFYDALGGALESIHVK